MTGAIQALGDLKAALEHRAREESEIAHALDRATAAAEQTYEKATRDTRRIRDDDDAAATAAHEQATRAIHDELDGQINTIQASLDAELASQQEKQADRQSKVDKEAEEARWVCDSIAESDERQANKRLQAIRSQVTDWRAAVARLEAGATEIAAEFGADAASYLGSPDPNPDQPEPTDPDASIRIAADSVAAVEALLTQWGALNLPRLARGSGFVTLAAILFLLTAALGFVVGQITGRLPGGIIGAGIGVALTIVCLLPLRAILSRVARRRVDDIGRHVGANLDRARLAIARAETLAEQRHAGALERIRRTATDEIQRIERQRREKTDAISARRTTREAEIRATHETDLAGLRAERQARTRQADEARDRAERQAHETFDRESSGATHQRDTAVTAAAAELSQRRTSLEQTWRERSTTLATQLTTLEETAQSIAPHWNDPAWAAWSPPTELTTFVPVASIRLDLADLPGGLSSDPALPWPGPPTISLPLALEFPRIGSLLIETDTQGRPAALELARDAMLRLLTALPPGKVRFTVVDPVGLGQNFAAFMHLADQEERLISRRIWTDPRHIEQRLADLTEHMESVIQKYLRNEFSSIEDYNTQAGQIAEPYRFLVIADFPTELTDIAAKRLASIADSGARCGVHTIIVADPSKPSPPGITLDDLRTASLVIEAKGPGGTGLQTAQGGTGLQTGVLRAGDPILHDHPIATPTNPAPDQTTNLLRTIGEHAGDASRVQLPFEAVTPPPDKRWTRSSADELRIPLGRKGATQIQELTLGRGTLQHALIAGKTGSGKSTLLHVLITSAALWYSPDELELYLVDFKKGVEFQTYAANMLPHARVVAIETDREFGLAVLRRLDQELTHRGDAFRELGVQSLPDYRAQSTKPMPRSLLVIDEFQELFVEDDTVAQESSLLLDRLVRQGRAFGMHVLLGSQTLGGAYSLARTTMGQMNVRVALQCDEMDSYLILSEENAAARLLERPGEAIYNDAGGKVEGNSPFQIVWLPAARRDAALHEVTRLATERALPAPSCIVFEGNVPADPERNRSLVAATSPPAKTDPIRLYLGEPTAIAPPAAAELRRQSGANLLIVGQRPDAARSLTAIAGLSFALQHAATPGARLIFLDGAPTDATDWESNLLAADSPLPIGVRTGDVNDAEALIVELAAETDRRHKLGAAGEPSILLLIYALQRFRDLRKSDDFSFSSSDEGDPLDKLFTRILEEGPEVGIHVVLWCDTVTNLERILERRTLRAIDQRVLLQMSAMDSTAIMDAPTAANLGPNRAILWSDDLGRAMRFRPYAEPAPTWLARILPPETRA